MRTRLPRPRVWHPYALWSVAVALMALHIAHGFPVAVALYIAGLFAGIASQAHTALTERSTR